MTLKKSRCGEVGNLSIVNPIGCRVGVAVPGLFAQRMPHDPYASCGDGNHLDGSNARCRSGRQCPHYFGLGAPPAWPNVIISLCE